MSGSDLKPNENTRRLESLGVRVFFGHAAGNVAGANVVVYSSAIARENPEVARARELEIDRGQLPATLWEDAEHDSRG